ncbi:hypothetical protein [Papillibacter cinnamivorans]|uniref:Homeodomain-like domain-containing protein n=1 Tax=Papillibacter cinnamivorans DSM 12816 TaxID=1122930 RepID=A0A1W1YPT7_9FIRM|nr:hypothetical protein [Papillibacter cinnamivorans]SMC38187.1 hypothetical protein SAMN02745168_0603 [Papillibacter cinnamivorans DSM 12816]
MLMTDDEIRTSIRQAKYPKLQRKILADLNVCDVSEIDRIVGAIKNPEKPKAKTVPNLLDKSRAMILYEQGLSDYAMAEELKVSRSSVLHWRNRNGLIPNCKKGGKTP